MTLICTICARGGSKGVSGKNTRMIAGKPLTSWTVEPALATGVFDFIAVSSDSAAILTAARDAGADHTIVRPAALATDHAGKIPAIAHALRAAEAAYGQKANTFVDLDATSPLRDISDITGAIDLLHTTGAPNVITGMTSRHSPYFNMVERKANGAVHISKPLPSMVLRRQDSPACFDMNGSVYVWDRDRFLDDPQVFYSDTQLFEMPEERSVDIDSPLDFKIVEMLLSQKNAR